MMSSIKIGVSSCLLGEHVRYDGEHKLDRNIVDTLGSYFSFVSVCPEVGAGLPVPREMMRLEGNSINPHLMMCKTRVDMTKRLQTFSQERCRDLEKENICGFIFKERSPSCGLTSVPLFESDTSDVNSVGLFAREVVRIFPLMPMAEAESLNDGYYLKEFVERVNCFAAQRSQNNESGVDRHSMKSEQLS
jgi:uncharacterized protein YbbK (DUF523 family)